MAAPFPQRLITINVNGTDNQSTVFYTYTSPIDGSVCINSPKCELKCDAPINSLFMLDYVSTLNGWTIIDTSPKGSSPALEQVPGAMNQSVMTINPYTSPGVFNFYINYKNVITGALISIDPQEGNIPRRNIS